MTFSQLMHCLMTCRVAKGEAQGREIYLFIERVRR